MPVLSHRHSPAIAAGIAPVAGAVAAPVGHAATKPTAPMASTPSTKHLHDDFNGDGYPDVAVGDVRRGGHVLHGPVSRTGRWSRVSSN
ncbi:FG-GAP repeat protein [Streptomyces sp. NPDC058239]|uniref:FG-GAP repeat protein n=1 Tax=unclassified Streptomyces TaxID=2593676 RepID=UPI00364F4D08